MAVVKVKYDSDKDKVDKAIARLDEGIKQLFESEKYAQYLKAMSKFHSYSFNNTMLIFLQKPDASLVAGASKWKNQFERNVINKKDYIEIVAPRKKKDKYRKPLLDPETNTPLTDENGKALYEWVEYQKTEFVMVKVYDVSQTEGKPLPEMINDVDGKVDNFDDFIEALKRTSPYPIEFMPLSDGLDGYVDAENKKVAIDDSMSEVQTVGAIIHEISHEKLHIKKSAKEKTIDSDESKEPTVRKNQKTMEIEAESIAYAVCSYFGIDTGENSFGYIAAWSEDKELKELKGSLETIKKTTADIINEVEYHLSEITREKEKNEPITALSAEIDRFAFDFAPNDYVGNITNRQQAVTEIQNLIISGNSIEIKNWLQGIVSDNSEFSLQAKSLIEKLDKVSQGIQLDNTETEERQEPILETPEKEVISDFIVPDPAITDEFMQSFGYIDGGMHPLTKDRALELAENGVTVYLLHGDNTEAMANTAEEIANHNGLFGVTKEEWEAVQSSIPLRDIEKRFMDNPADSVLVYQISDDDPDNLLYKDYDKLKESPKRDSYIPVYTLNVEIDAESTNFDVLVDALQHFSFKRPADFTSRLVSPSDILALKRDGAVSYHYCDAVGFVELPDFQRSNYLKTAEMTAEDDLNMIDGVMNNGQKTPTVAELEKEVNAGKSISLLDLANAVKAESRSKKQQDFESKRESVLEKLKNQPKQETTPKKSKKTKQKEI